MAGLVERDHELGALRAAVARAAGGAGSAVLVEGEAGIGKTALLEATRAAADEVGLRTLRARGQPLERGFAFGVARQLLARELLGADEDRRERLLRGAAGLAAPVLLDSGSAPDTAAALHGLTWLVTALADEAPLLVCVDDLQWADAPSRALLATLVARVGEVPAAIVVAARPMPGALRTEADVALAAGATSLRPSRLTDDGVAALLTTTLAVSELTNERGSEPTTAHPPQDPLEDGSPPELAGLDAADDPLGRPGAVSSDDGTSRRLRAGGSSDTSSGVSSDTSSGVSSDTSSGVSSDTWAVPDAAFVAAVRQATGGTPFLVRAVAEAARRRGVKPTAEAAAAVEAVGAGAVTPEVTRRLAGLAPESVRVAQALAVAGDGTTEVLLAGIGELTLTEAQTGLAALRGAGLLAPGDPPAFEHALVRAAVLEGLADDERRRAHGRAARLRAADGDFERAAAHLEEAPAAGDPAAVELLEAVARSARRRGDPQRAVQLLRRALAEPPAPERRAGLLLRLGRLEVATNDPAGADRLAAAATAAASADDPTTRLRAGLAHGQSLTVVGRWSEGLWAMRSAVEQAEAGGADADAIRFAKIELASELMPVRADAQARAERETMLREAITGSGDDLDRLAWGVLAFHHACGAPRRDHVVELVGRALEHGIVPGVRSPAALHPLFALTCAGAPGMAEPGLAAVVAATRARGAETLVRTVSAWHAMALLYEDRLADAEQAALDAIPRQAGGSLAVARLLGASVRGALALERGDLQAAAAELDPPVEHEPEAAATTFADGYLVARARLRFAQGDAEEAHRIVTAAGARLTAAGTESPGMMQWRRDAALYAHATGRHEEAGALAEEEVAAARALGAPRPLAAALRAQAVVVADGADGARGTRGPGATNGVRGPADHQRATALLHEALAVIEGTRLDVERAKTLLALAQLARDAEERKERLRQALDAAFRTGAQQLTEDVRAALVAAGGRPRRAALTGAHALTPAEARTAGLAAQGRSNREIAETLFLTRSTVEGHLTSAYRKLGIRRRDELAAALGSADAAPV